MSTTRNSARVFHAISDPNRRAMLDLLFERERHVQEIAEHFDFSFQGVSQHLNVLADAGLVSRRKEGRYRYYRARPNPLKDVYDWVNQYRHFWNRSLDRLGEYLDESE